MFNLWDLPCSVDHVLGIDTRGVQLYIESNDYHIQCVQCTQAEIMFWNTILVKIVKSQL